MLAQVPELDPWRYQFHVEVWVLVAFLIIAYIYMVKVIGPTAVGPGKKPVSRGNIAAFVGAMILLWTASDWPLHDISEEYLYSAHMLQHMMLMFLMPPLVLLATPTWLLRVLIGNGRAYKVFAFMCRPVFAGLAFNAGMVIVNIPGVVNSSVASAPLHYSLHVLVVTVSLLMWMPVVGPLPELRISPMGKIIYLFIMSLIPTIPAAWLTFAESAVYTSYDQPIRVWGISVASDQQMAGAIMKIGGGMYIWAILVFLFFRRFAIGYDSDYSYRRPQPGADVGSDATLPSTEDHNAAHTEAVTAER